MVVSWWFHGFSLFSMVFRGFSWFFIVFHGFSWFFMFFSWFFIVFHGFSWFSLFFMVFHCFSWFFMVLPSKYRGFLSIFPTKPCKTSPMNAESHTKTISKRCPPSSPSSWQWSAHSSGQISDYHQIGKEEATYSSRFVWICSDHIMSTLD